MCLKTIITLTLLLFALLVVEGIRSGSSSSRSSSGIRSGSSNSRSSSGSSSRSGSRSTYRSTFRSNSVRRGTSSRGFDHRYSSNRNGRYQGPTFRMANWQTSYGVLFGLAAYQRRQMYHRHPHKEPTVCFNEWNLRGGTYGYFICPEVGMADKYAYCCEDITDSDDVTAQKCCTYQEHRKQMIIGVSVGSVAGVIWFVTCVACCCCPGCRTCRNRCCKCACASKKDEYTAVTYDANAGDVTTNTPSRDTVRANANTDDISCNEGPPWRSDGDLHVQMPAPPPYSKVVNEPRHRTPSSDPPAYEFKDVTDAPAYLDNALPYSLPPVGFEPGRRVNRRDDHLQPPPYGFKDFVEATPSYDSNSGANVLPYPMSPPQRPPSSQSYSTTV